MDKSNHSTSKNARGHILFEEAGRIFPPPQSPPINSAFGLCGKGVEANWCTPCQLSPLKASNEHVVKNHTFSWCGRPFLVH